MSDPQGFGPTTTENDTGSSGTAKPARSWLRPIMAIVAVAAIAAIAMVACAGAGGSWFLSGKNGGGEQIAEGTVPEATPPTATVEPVPTPPTIAVADAEEPTWLLCSPTSITYEGGKMRYFKDLSTESVLGREDFRIRGLQPQQTCVSIIGDDLEIAKQALLNTEGQCEVDGNVDPSLTVRPLCADSKGALVSAEMLREHLSTSYQAIDGLKGVSAKCCPGSIFHGCTAPPKTQGPVASNP